MTSRRFWVKGNRDDYAHFLARTHNANLIHVSSLFNFEIRSHETASLIARRVSIWGECSNNYQLSDAFIGLMITSPGSGFSTEANGSIDLKPCNHPRLLWHFSTSEPVYGHHVNSRIIYFRLESARFLHLLSNRGMALSVVVALHGQEASDTLIHIAEQLLNALEQISDPQTPDEWSDRFLRELVDELHCMSALKADRSMKAAQAHVGASLEWLVTQGSDMVNLNQLAIAINVTPRTIQSSFQSQFRMTPMRWLKLWRINQLRSHLFNNPTHQQSANQLIEASGLGSLDTATRFYREIYGLTPQEEINKSNLARDGKNKKLTDAGKPLLSIDEAITLLQKLKQTPIEQGIRQQIIHFRVKVDSRLSEQA